MNSLGSLLSKPWTWAVLAAAMLAGVEVRAQTTARRASYALRREAPPARGPAANLAAERLGDFPALPPDPYEAEKMPLPPLAAELQAHGGSYLYAPEGDRLNWPHPDQGAHYDLLRLPETWVEPKPLTLFSEFLGADPIFARPRLKWPGAAGYMWDLRLVAHGRSETFAFALEQNDQRQDVIGEQLMLDLDLRLTGTERFHVQFRPLGEKNSGGSFYQFSNPTGYVDNATAVPDRYWFEGELRSLLGAGVNPYAVLDYNFVAGKFPLALHNSLLMNDEILGVAVGKNNLYAGPLSNVNVQAFYAFNDVDGAPGSGGDNRLYGVHAAVDHRRVFYEMTYAFLQHETDASRDAHYAAFSSTRFYGPLTLAARALFRFGNDTVSRGEGKLTVLESNYTRVFEHNRLGIEKGVFYANAFYAAPGWSPISGGNLNRLRTAFETDPLVRIAAGVAPDDRWGLALGVQLLRHHADESWIPEIAFEAPQGEPVWGLGLRHLRKVGSRAYLEMLTTFALSDDPQFEREGVFLSYHVLF